MQTLDLDSTSLGGGGMAGLGSGTNPLLWLITLAFLGRQGGILGNENGGAGVLAGETQSKLDCLSQQHQTLMAQIAKNDTDQNFVTLGTAIDSLANISRDGQSAVTGQINDLRSQLAECCCDLRTGQQATQTAIAMQTNELTTNATANTQRIVDLLNAQNVERKDERIHELEQAAQTATLTGIIREACGRGQGNSDLNQVMQMLKSQAA